MKKDTLNVFVIPDMEYKNSSVLRIQFFVKRCWDLVDFCRYYLALLMLHSPQKLQGDQVVAIVFFLFLSSFLHLVYLSPVFCDSIPSGRIAQSLIPPLGLARQYLEHLENGYNNNLKQIFLNGHAAVETKVDNTQMNSIFQWLNDTDTTSTIRAMY